MGFGAIPEQDARIPHDRKQLIQRIEHDLMPDKNVIGIFYGGSLGNHTTDVYSDIDLRIVVKDDAFEAYRSAKRTRAGQWGNVLFFEDHPSSIYCIAHYDTFIKVDAFYYKKSFLEPSIWLQNIRIVQDTEAFLASVQTESKMLVYQPSIEEVDDWRSKFFAHVHEAYRRTMRKEYFYALHCLDCMRLLIIQGWYMDAGFQPNTFGDWAKLEGKHSRLQKNQLDLLNSWFSASDPEAIRSVVKSLLPEFKKIHHQLCSKIGLSCDPEWIETILERSF